MPILEPVFLPADSLQRQRQRQRQQHQLPSPPTTHPKMKMRSVVPPAYEEASSQTPSGGLAPSSSPIDWETRPYINLEFTFAQHPMRDYASSGWVAKMGIRAKDPVCLLREDFHWSEANVQKEPGSIIQLALSPFARYVKP